MSNVGAAGDFVNDAEAKLAAANVEQQRAQWLAEKAAGFDRTPNLSSDTRRKLDLIKLSLTTPGPSDPARTAEMARIAAAMEAMYGAAKYDGLDVEAITKIMQTSRDRQRLLEVWRGWHSIARPMKSLYSRFVELTNAGARELGYRDAGALWRSKYDMPPEAFAAEADRLWTQVKPLYVSLHAYVRAQLVKKYGRELVPENGPIPAH